MTLPVFIASIFETKYTFMFFTPKPLHVKVKGQGQLTLGSNDLYSYENDIASES